MTWLQSLTETVHQIWLTLWVVSVVGMSLASGVFGFLAGVYVGKRQQPCMMKKRRRDWSDEPYDEDPQDWG